MSRKDKKTVLAGGAVVRRVRPGKDAEILIIHRDRYKDWTLPKGKVEAGESVVAARGPRGRARRPGVTIRLQSPLDTVLYPLGSGATKEVRYWSGQPLEVIKRAPDDEVDVVSWLPVKAALHRLTFDHDKELVRQHLEQPADHDAGAGPARQGHGPQGLVEEGHPPPARRARSQAGPAAGAVPGVVRDREPDQLHLGPLPDHAGAVRGQRRDRRRDPRHPDRGDRHGRPGSASSA